MKLRCVVHLNDDQRATLKQLLKAGHAPARSCTKMEPQLPLTVVQPAWAIQPAPSRGW